MEFFLFTTELSLAQRAEQAGIDSVVVDWETRGKERRQNGFNLEMNRDTAADVRRLSAAVGIPVTVRINPLHDRSLTEIELALESGARLLMLPMAHSPDEVRTFLALVGGRARTIVQIETPQLADRAAELAALSWDYAYIGLNDLMVTRGKSSIWEAIIDGTAEGVCTKLSGRRYGFGGATIIGGGEPIINILILHELVRLGGCISIMRRTFKKELLDRDLAAEMRTLRSFAECSERRGELARLYDHLHLQRIIGKNTVIGNGERHAQNFAFNVQ